MDWLNQRTDENTGFFGVVVELLKIDGSRPAPNFKLVVFPNEWRKANIRGSGGPRSERSERYRVFIQELIDDLKERGFTNARKASPTNWFFVFIWSYVDRLRFQFRQRRPGPRRSLSGSGQRRQQAVIDELQSSKDSIESNLQEDVSWERLEDKQASRIAVYRPGSTDNDSETLEESGAGQWTRSCGSKKCSARTWTGWPDRCRSFGTTPTVGAPERSNISASHHLCVQAAQADLIP